MTLVLPIFIPKPLTEEEEAKVWTEWPKCRCGEPGPLDEVLGVCRKCWRVLVYVRAVVGGSL